LPVYGDGSNVRDWIHVHDHCAGVLLALERGKVGQTYCLGGNAERANIDLVRHMCRALDAKRPRKDAKKHEERIAFVTDRLGHDWRYAIDDTKAKNELGFTRKYDFDHGLDATLDWYLANESWWRAIQKDAKG